MLQRIRRIDSKVLTSINLSWPGSFFALAPGQAPANKTASGSLVVCQGFLLPGLCLKKSFV
jgi:hypothetical protein